MPESSPKTRKPFITGMGLLTLTVFAFFLLSGGCGLLYQVVWTRKLVLLFGTASYAVSTVLSVFFLGLGLGSLWGGRLADRSKRPLFVYGVFEVVIGLWAVLFIFGIDWAEAAVVPLLRLGIETRAIGVAIRTGLAFVFLIVPVTLMGATLPLLSRYVASNDKTRGLRIGALYSLNTFGAVAGCAYAGFKFLPEFGYTYSTLIGAAINVGVGLAAFAISAVTEPIKDGETKEPPAEPGSRAKAKHRTAMAMVFLAFGLSGFCSLGLEVMWTRLLGTVFIGTTYAFTTMLSTVLFGIALGSIVAALFIDRIRKPVVAFGIVQVAIGVACLYTIIGFESLPERFQQAQFDTGSANWEPMVRQKFILAARVLFLPTFLFGMTFPFAVKAATSVRAHLGRDVGRLYTANTFGGVIGALAGGYFIIPMMGVHSGLVLLAFVLVGSGILLLAACPSTGAVQRIALVAFAIVFASVPYVQLPVNVAEAMNRRFLPDPEEDPHEVIYTREGVEGTVVVSQPKDLDTGSERVLWINGVQATVSIEKGIKMNRLQGVLPLLFDRDPENVLFMCFGSGITCGTLGLSEFDRIDAVEINHNVLEAAPLFKADNFNVTENPRIHFTIDDGRNFLLTTPGQYDVITFEPMPLALAGVSTFYTKEYYELCLDRLAPGGLVSQWVPFHSLNPEVVTSLVYTFREVFPEYCAFFINADLFLIGSNEPLTLSYAKARDRLSQLELKAGLEKVGFHDVEEVLACFFLTKSGVDAFSEGGSSMSDDRPWAEFVAPKIVYDRTVQDTLALLRPNLASPLELMSFEGLSEEEAERARAALERRHAARVFTYEGVEKYYGAMTTEDHESLFIQALDTDPGDFMAKYYLDQILAFKIRRAIDLSDFDKAETLINVALTYLSGYPAYEEFTTELSQPRAAAQ